MAILDNNGDHARAAEVDSFSFYPIDQLVTSPPYVNTQLGMLAGEYRK